MYEGSTNPRLTQELRSATDIALGAMEVTAESLGKAVYKANFYTCGPSAPSMAQPCWACYVDKVRFLDALVSQMGCFGDGDTDKDCPQHFSAVLK